ncbi:hypothetical protein AJ85_06130 [Alkalihalobacillus alcalophilus ATCC 27647 = CGMCC 1.3604]|uniref:DUF58 domain-containing protein n=1 Tax=Alkalihalobacillus alcalophilus ATCC 27647 = CGMCC 1.3604 TaxID=1218173 RepID=A0A4S4K2T0_ALKAL|nr:DUF58 domain-containing protein [Alkalihalobacillus alcalophilus]MED1561580.1 DUF58 domain-containing protein [Alkalihalobacillus alcalophilus]THG91237.1 hypothetical protein AJ85_06130 [Alkalihalobacillus alcalophilus ATCC 27647 = CGMCC 1.3604]
MKPLLFSQLEARLKKIQFTTKKRLSAGQQGNRRATGFGRTLDFSDYRMYHPGDDLRQIDWNVYARTNKHYIKRYLDEKEMQVAIYIDCSLSMGFDEAKWHRTKQLAALLGYIGFSSGDRVSVIPVSPREKPFLHKKGGGYTEGMISFLNQINADETGSFFEQLIQFRQSRASVHFLITDCYEESHLIIEKVSHFQSHQPLMIVQVTTEEELNPSIRGDKKLIDSESNDYVNVTVRKSTVQAYQERMNTHFQQIKNTFVKRGISIVQINADAPLEEMLLFLKKERFIL